MPANLFGLAFHHLGLAVREAGEARRFVGGLGYRCGAAIYDPLQNVHAQMCAHPTMPSIEILYPEPSVRGPLEGLIARFPSGIVYHLCYTTPSIADATARLAAVGLKPKPVVPPQPAILFAGAPVAFYMLIGIGLVELIEGSGEVVPPCRPPDFAGP